MDMLTASDVVQGLQEAIEAAPAEIPIAETNAIGHQGDVNFARHTGEDAADVTTSQLRVVVAKGSHGSHVLVGDIGLTKNGIVVGKKGATLFHTDQPKCRHGAVKFEAGVWAFWNHAEMLGGEVVKQRD